MGETVKKNETVKLEDGKIFKVTSKVINGEKVTKKQYAKFMKISEEYEKNKS